MDKENILPPRTHNNPPFSLDVNPMDVLEPVKPFLVQLAERNEKVVKRANELAAMVERLPDACDDDETAGKLTEAIKSCTALAKAAAEAKKVEKQPFVEGGRAVDAFFEKLTAPVAKLKDDMSDMLTDYQRKLAEIERKRREAEAAEQRRIQREAEAAAREAERVAREAREAEAARVREAAQAAAKLAGEARRKAEAEERARQAAEQARLDAERAEAERAREEARKARAEAEAAKEAANAKAADMTRARSDLGAVASLRTEWKHEVQDVTLVPRHYLVVDEAKVRSAIKAAIHDGKCALTIPGVRIFKVETTVVR